MSIPRSPVPLATTTARWQARCLGELRRVAHGVCAEASGGQRAAGTVHPEARQGAAMRFPGRVKKEGKFWLVEIPAFDASTQGRTKHEALAMAADLVETMADTKGF